jgi:transcriptional regulator with XRE-family HTH domain
VIPRPRIKALKSQDLHFRNIIGQRLRRLPDAKNLTQGDLEKRSGLLRCAISSLENGHIVHGLNTLEKLAHALEVPFVRLFTDDPHATEHPAPQTDIVKGKHDREMESFTNTVSHMSDKQRQLLLFVASKMAIRE